MLILPIQIVEMLTDEACAIEVLLLVLMELGVSGAALVDIDVEERRLDVMKHRACIRRSPNVLPLVRVKSRGQARLLLLFPCLLHHA